jgi:hypothetical protein
MLTQVERETPVTPREKAAATVLDTRSRVLDAVSAFADLNQRVLGGLIELSSEAALETVRAFTEMQAAAVDAVRPTPAAKVEVPEPGETPGTEAWYRRGLDRAVGDAQRLVKFMEKNGQIVARSAERRQSAGERAGKEIKEALDLYADRMRKVFNRN